MNLSTRDQFPKGDLHRKLGFAPLLHAVAATETLITLMVTVLATLFMWLNASTYSAPPWSWMAVMLSGIGAASILIAIGKFDRETASESITLTLEDFFHLENITDESIRIQITQAIAHRARLQEVFLRNDGMKEEFLKALLAVDEWLVGIRKLAHLLVPFQSEMKRQIEIKLQLFYRIGQLEQRAENATDSRTKAQLRETIAGRRHQQRAIEQMESLVEQGLLRLERAVAALGTMNAQLSMLAVRNEQETGVTKLADDISAEIQEIDAVLIALDRVHSSDLVTFENTLEDPQ